MALCLPFMSIQLDARDREPKAHLGSRDTALKGGEPMKKIKVRVLTSTELTVLCGFRLWPA